MSTSTPLEDGQGSRTPLEDSKESIAVRLRNVVVRIAREHPDLEHAALWLAEAGLRVFPLETRGKKPRIRAWQKVATSDAEQVEKWWGQWPDANIGLVVGSRLAVLDVDKDKGGVQSLGKLLKEIGRDDLRTLSAKTGTGGSHLYYADDPSNPLGQTTGFMPGLDTRAGGKGYVVAPPSIHPNGTPYTWNTGGSANNPHPVKPVPQKLRELVESAQRRQTDAQRNGDLIPEGSRDDTLASYAGTMRRSGMTEQEIEAALTTVNAQRCQPPLPEEDVHRIAQSVARYEPDPAANPIQPAPEDEFDADPEAKPAVVQSRRESGPLFDPAKARFGRFLASDPPPREYVIKDVLPLGISGQLASEGGLGKSALIYQLGFSVTTGMPFLGMEMGEPGAFVYLAAEDDEGELWRRGRAFLEYFEAQYPDFGRKRVAERLYIVDRVGADNLLTRASSFDGDVKQTDLVDRLLESLSQIPDLRALVLDPASRFRGGKANDEQDTTRFVEAMEAVRKVTGATVLTLTHVNKAGARRGGGQEIVRGSSALVDGGRWTATLQRLPLDRAPDYGIAPEDARRYLKLDIPKTNYTAPFPGLWLRREGSGILVPWELTDQREARKQSADEQRYTAVLEALKDLLQEEGPMTRRQLRKWVGKSGVLRAGAPTVSSVTERAVLEGALLEKHEAGQVLLEPSPDNYDDEGPADPVRSGRSQRGRKGLTHE